MSTYQGPKFAKMAYRVIACEGDTFIVIDGYAPTFGGNPESIIPRMMGFTNAADLVDWQRRHHLSEKDGSATS